MINTHLDLYGYWISRCQYENTINNFQGSMLPQDSSYLTRAGPEYSNMDKAHEQIEEQIAGVLERMVGKAGGRK